MIDPATDSELARRLADEAGAALLELRARTGFADGRALAKAGDRASHELLVGALAAARPSDAVLSEEGVDDPRRLEADRVWIVDPLDGTREFSEAGRKDWAVHVALWERGALTAGAVALPAQGVTVGTDHPPAAPTGRRDVPRVVVSRSRPPEFVASLVERIGAELVPMGSAGAKIAAVIRGDAEVYVHAGGQFEWDSAAPVVVAQSIGLHTSRVDGSPLRYNCPDPRLPDLVVCRPEFAEDVLAGIASR